MQHKPSTARITAIVLAAGQASRFGSTKLLAQFRGKALLRHSLEAAGVACPGRVCLVAGHDADNIIAAAAGIHDKAVINTKFKHGMGSSIAAGLRACADDADAVLLILADQPLVTSAHLCRLIRTWSGSRREIVASTFDERHAPPVLFPGGAFDALKNLSGDSGAREILSSTAFTVRTINCPAARFDIDRPEDLKQLDCQ